jgi:hypothetical protein
MERISVAYFCNTPSRECADISFKTFSSKKISIAEHKHVHATAPDTASCESRVSGNPLIGVPSTFIFQRTPIGVFVSFLSTNKGWTSHTTSEASTKILVPLTFSSASWLENNSAPKRASANTHK